MKIDDYDKVVNILEQDVTMKGTYVGVKWSNTSGKNIREYFEVHGIPNMLKDDEYHSTLAYSKVEFNHDTSNKSFKAFTKKLHIFEDRRTKKKVLVILLDSNDLTNRHKEIYKNNSKATYDFDEYIPHITLSDDVSEMKEKDLEYLTSDSFGDNELQEQFESISNGKEYTKILDLNK